MNNKGMTLVELLITFSLLMIIVVGMFNLILDVKLDLDNKQIVKDVVEYSNFLNSDIHYDLITRRPFALAIKDSSTAEWNCNAVVGDCSIENSKMVVSYSETFENESVSITGAQSVNACNDFYPCAIYAYHDRITESTGDSITAKFKIIAVNTDKTKGDNGYGVKYNNVFESVPNQKYIDDSKLDITMKFENNYFKINYPLYVTGDDTNYGFMISYPFNSGSSS